MNSSGVDRKGRISRDFFDYPRPLPGALGTPFIFGAGGLAGGFAGALGVLGLFCCGAGGFAGDLAPFPLPFPFPFFFGPNFGGGPLLALSFFLRSNSAFCAESNCFCFHRNSRICFSVICQTTGSRRTFALRALAACGVGAAWMYWICCFERAGWSAGLAF